MYRVTLSDGTVYDGLSQNGTYYVTDRKVSESDFAGKLRGVKIEYEPDASDDSEAYTEYHELMRCESVLALPGGYGFTLRAIEGTELEMLKLRGQVEYTAMMTETEI